MRLLTAHELAERMSISTARAYALMREGVLPTVHMGRQVRVCETALEEFIAGGGKALPGGWRRDPEPPRTGA